MLIISIFNSFLEEINLKIKWKVKPKPKKTVNSFGCFTHCEKMRNS